MSSSYQLLFTKSKRRKKYRILLQPNSKDTVVMEKYTRKQMDVSLYAERGTPNMRVMRGKALMDEEACDFKFVENPPSGPRSTEIGRTMHARYVRRPDGAYTITLRVSVGDKYLREQLTTEVAEIVKTIEADYKAQKTIEKKKLKEGENVDEKTRKSKEG